MNFNIYNSIILAGIIQGFIFGLVVLLSKKYRAPATLLLAAFILSFSFDNFQYYLEDVGLITESQLMQIIFIPFELLSGPLFLLYGLSLMKQNRAVSRKDQWLFLPFLLALAISSAYKIITAADYHNESVDAFFDHMESGLEYVSIAFDSSILVYLYFRIKKHDQQAETGSQLAWFKIVLVSLFVLSLIWIYITIKDYFYDVEYWYALYIGMSGVIYWMGHVGIYKFGVEQQRKKIRGFINGMPEAVTDRKNEHIVALEKLLIGERRFLNPTLTLDAIAEDLKLSKSHLSRLINAELGMGFPDYLNSLRVEEAKSYLINPEFANYTLLAIGLEAGFNSKTTFNTAFKKATSQTPSEFRNSALN